MKKNFSMRDSFKNLIMTKNVISLNEMIIVHYQGGVETVIQISLIDQQLSTETSHCSATELGGDNTGSQG